MATIQKVSGIDFANISKFDGVDISAVGSINFIGKPPTGNLLLDTSYGSGAEAAYSVRKLRTAYTGAAMQVQDTTGGATAEIGFDVDNNLDTATLLAFAGTNEVRVSIWYDQSTNGNNAVQISVTQRPIVVAAGGALVKENGRPALIIGVAKGSLQFDTAITTVGTLNWLVKTDTFGYNRPISNAVELQSSSKGYVNTIAGTNPWNPSNISLNGVVDTQSPFGSNLIGVYHNAYAIGASTINPLTEIGYTGENNRSWNGPMQEVLIYSDQRTSQRSDIEENIGDYYTQNQAPYLLDTYTGAAAAYSLRKLRTDYTGFAIKVQDNVGGATQDIGFNIFGELDTVSLIAYAGSNDVFVETWYDQSGNGNNATKATSANRPKIYDATTGVVTENGKPAVEFDGSNDGLTLSSLTYGNGLSLISLYNQTSTNGRIWSDDNTGTQGYWILFGVDNINDQEVLINDGGGFDNWTHQTAPLNQQNLLGIYFSSSEIIDSLNGTAQTQSVTGFSPPINLSGSSAKFAIGNSGNMTDPMQMKGQEFILYNSDESAKRTDIESNINTFYDIYTPTPDPLLLNLYPGSAAAYSLRKLNANYTGSAILVQDTVGGATKAIGFDASGDLDTAELLAYAGSNDVFVETWYDQSGSGDNVTQPSSGARPQIVSSGAVITENGKPSIYFVNNTKQLAKTSGWGGTNVNTCDIVNVHRRASGSGNPLFWYQSSFQIANYGTPSYGLGWGNPTTGPAADTNQNIFYGKASNTVGQIFLNNVASAPGTLSGTRHFSGSFAFQGRPGYLTYSAPEIYQQEFIQWDLNQSDSDRTGITENIGGHYDIVLPGLLDENPGAAAAYSLRRLSSTYTGSAVQVQRADNVGGTTDIGFDGYGDLDTAALTTAAAGNSMVVVTWFDQSGNSNDATQATSANRPKIYDGTTGVIVDGTKPAILSEASKTFTTTLTLANDPIFASVVASNVSRKKGIVGLGGAAAYKIWSIEAWANNNSFMFWIGNGTDPNYATISSTPSNVQALITVEKVNDISKMWRDGALAGTLTDDYDSSGAVGFGQRNATGIGKYSEVIIYDSAQNNTTRTGIEENVGGYYDIPLAGLLDENPGAAAAYSLRRLSSTYTGSAIQVQRADNVGGTHEIGFDSYGELDTTALTTAAAGNSMVVATWYDQSGSGNNATQGTSANRPKIYDATTGVVTENGKPTVEFDGQNYLPIGNYSSLTEGELFTTVRWLGDTSTRGGFKISTQGNDMHFPYYGGLVYDNFGSTTRYAFNPSITLNQINLYNTLSKSSEWTARLNGNVERTSATNTVGFSSGNIGSFTMNHNFSEFILYNAVQSTANRTDIEENIGGYYDIPLPGLLDENPGAAAAYSLRRLSSTYTGSAVQVQRADNVGGTHEIGFDSYGDLDTTALTTAAAGNDMVVVTWYDQSGSGNNATQGTSANRPKIYDGTTGVVTENGKPAVYGDGSNKHLTTSSVSLNNGEWLAFAVAARVSGTKIMGQDSAPRINQIINNTGTAAQTIGFNTSGGYVVDNSATFTATTNLVLNTSQLSSNVLEAFWNGQGNGGTAHTNQTTAASPFTIFKNYPNDYFTGYISEVIVYASDQSDKRPSIEDNVGDYYGIEIAGLLDQYSGAAAGYSLRKLSNSYTGFAVKVQDNVGGATQDIGFNADGELDTVALLAYAGSNDVFVETWYDQSGNGVNATQPSSGLRPQIVSSGVVITENGKPAIEGDGNKSMAFTSITFSDLCFVNVSTISHNAGNLGDAAYGGASGTFGAYGFDSTTLRWRFAGSTSDFTIPAQTNGTQYLAFANRSSTSLQVSFQGNVVGTDFNSAQAVIYQLLNGNGNGLALSGTAQEFIFYPSDQSGTPQTGIEANINFFYDIY